MWERITWKKVVVGESLSVLGDGEEDLDTPCCVLNILDTAKHGWKISQGKISPRIPPRKYKSCSLKSRNTTRE